MTHDVKVEYLNYQADGLLTLILTTLKSSVSTFPHTYILFDPSKRTILLIYVNFRSGLNELFQNKWTLNIWKILKRHYICKKSYLV